MCRRSPSARGPVIRLALVLLALAVPAWGQRVVIETRECNRTTATQTEAAWCQARKRQVAERTVSRVTVRGRWARLAQDLPLKPGDTYTAEKQSASMEALEKAITQGVAGDYLQKVGELEVLLISIENPPSPDPDTVAVEFVPHYVNVSLVKIGNNVLPIPRLAEPRPLSQVPMIVRKLRPSATVDYDQVWGTAVAMALDSTVFKNSQDRLSATADAKASLDESLHDANGALAYVWKKDEGTLRSAAATFKYQDARAPLGEQINDSDARLAAAHFMWKLAPNTRLYADATERQSHDSLGAAGASPEVRAPSDAQLMRVLFEAIPRRTLGFARAALWVGSSSAGGNVDSSHRSAIARLAYEKELSVRPSHAVGIEVMAGAGRIWGDAPAYDRFFGGSTAQKFLYDGADSTTMQDAPSGPPFRSFGAGAAGILTPGGTLIGGKRYWHLNVDVTIPLIGVPKASLPLIPDEDMGMTNPTTREPVTLKDVMITQVEKTGPNMLESVLAQQMSEEEARARAHEMLDEVRPAAVYMIRDANVFAVKPLLILDAAGLSAPEGSETWLAAGAGIQLTVVTAKFEAGYARTIHGPTFGKRGAPFARLVFQRLF